MKFTKIMATSRDTIRYVPTPIPAGKPAWAASAEEVGLLEFLNVRNPLMLEVTGRSMEDCGIIEGDAILLSLGDIPVNGEIVVVRLEGEEYTVKRWRIEDKWGGVRRLYLVPANKEMTEREVTEVDSCEVVGVVKWIFKRSR